MLLNIRECNADLIKEGPEGDAEKKRKFNKPQFLMSCSLFKINKVSTSFD